MNSKYAFTIILLEIEIYIYYKILNKKSYNIIIFLNYYIFLKFNKKINF